MEEPKTTSDLVKEEIDSSLFLKEILKKGLINYSALTRQLLLKIQKRNKKANFASVLIAIQRYYDELDKSKTEDVFEKILSESELIMKNRITSLTLERTKSVMSLINKISQTIRWDLGDIMFIIQGSGEITIVIDKKNEKKFENLGKKIIEKKENLAILSVRESEELKPYSKDIVGYLALLTSTLSDNNINIVDIASTYKQIIFVIKEEDLTKAYETLNKLIKKNK